MEYKTAKKKLITIIIIYTFYREKGGNNLGLLELDNAMRKWQSKKKCDSLDKRVTYRSDLVEF